MVRARAAFDISPMYEDHWSGIPIVTAKLAEGCLGDSGVDWLFLYENILVPLRHVEILLARRSGSGMLPTLERLLGDGRCIPSYERAARSCIWPNVKTMAGYFRKEAFIVHDLSTLLTPEFHNGDTIAHHANRIVRDCETSDHVFCVSSATRGDVMAYLGVPGERTSVLPLGVHFEPGALYAETVLRRRYTTERYIVVLGTIEPRKNGSIVMELLARNPDIAQQYKIVFVGRDGWLAAKKALMDRMRAAGVSPDRVEFTGFVDDRTKLRLLMNCDFAIYPSFFEGFGLPVLECAVLGKICVASNSSSIPEVAPESSVLFDPMSVDSLAAAVRKAIDISATSPRNERSFTEIYTTLAECSWQRTYSHIRDWVVEAEPAP